MVKIIKSSAADERRGTETDRGIQNKKKEKEKTRDRSTHRGVFFFLDFVFFWLFLWTEELASRDLCVPVYMKKKTKNKKLMFLYKLQPMSHGTL